MKVASNTKSEGANLDVLRTPPEAAQYLRMAERTLMANVRKRKIPAVRINSRVLRFHLPSVLAALQK